MISRRRFLGTVALALGALAAALGLRTKPRIEIYDSVFDFRTMPGRMAGGTLTVREQGRTFAVQAPRAVIEDPSFGVLDSLRFEGTVNGRHWEREARTLDGYVMVGFRSLPS